MRALPSDTCRSQIGLYTQGLQAQVVRRVERVPHHFSLPYKAGIRMLKHPFPRAVTRIDRNRPDNGQSAFPDRESEVTKDITMKSMQNVKPAAPVAAYIGGKRNLARTIIQYIDAIPHDTYAEAFVGMGGVFLRRGLKPKSEVINDYNREVANFFRILQRHYQPFMDHLKWKVTSRSEFGRLMDIDPATMTDIERAARFLYLQRLAFGGKVSGKNFGVSVGMPSRFDMTRLTPLLEDAYERLSGVVIECLDYKEFIRRYDAPGTLFYLDPPYFGCEGDYGKELFNRAEFEAMAGLLAGIKGRFILSINDRPEVRKTFAKFHLKPVQTTYTIAGADKAKQVGELLISNVKLKVKK